MSIPTLAVGANYLFLSKNKYLYSIDVYNLNSEKYVNKKILVEVSLNNNYKM